MQNKLEYYRKEIDRTNKKIVSLIYQRSKLGFDKKMYDGQDSVFDAFYTRFIKNMCDKINSSDEKKIRSLDNRIYSLVSKRMHFGEPIARYKELHNLAITNNKRDKEILEKIADYAKEINFDKEKELKRYFSFMIQRTKDLQHCILEQLKYQDKSYKPIATCSTCVKEAIPLLMEEANSKIKRMNGRYVTKVEEGFESGIQTYFVKIFHDL